MPKCLAPSAVPGIDTAEASIFGGVAEELIYADFCTRYPRASNEVFRDANNPAAYLFFLVSHNPQFTEQLQEDYYTRLRGEGLMRIPDFIVHTAAETAFYEIKPNSTSGLSDGAEKVGILRAVYPFYRLPYVAGMVFVPRDHVIAQLGTGVQVRLEVQRAAAGLIVYRLCIDAERELELATVAALLAHVVREANKQRRGGQFRPIDLAPVFARDRQLADVARDLRLPFAVAAGAAGAVAWRFFWKAVVKRFAVREAAAVVIAAADGPLPVGDLIAVGLTIWTVVDIIRLSDELWRDARVIRDQGA